MKVLWFSITPANSDEYFNNQLKVNAGWLKALDKELQKKVELHVAFYHSKASEPFKYKKTMYHPIKHNKSFFKKVIDKITYPVINHEDDHIYLDLINKVQPDIIHIHGTENPFGCIINKVKIPIIVSIQSNITVYLHKFCSVIEEKYLKVKKQGILDIKSLLFPFSFKKTKKIYLKDIELFGYKF